MDAESDKPISPARVDPRGTRANLQPERRATPIVRKVPEPTPSFWLTKVATTAMGEATSDYLVHRFDPVIAVAFGAVALAIALAMQFWVRRYIPWIYWLAAAMVAVFGTMAADVLHVRFGVPYAVSTAMFAVVLAAVFLVWHSVEKTLSIHSIYTYRREVFYWLVIGATFALGTAAGDLTATTLHLGYFFSGVMFVGVIAIPALGYRFFGLNSILAFWFAYVVTRPIGASFADWLDKSHRLGGLAWGSGPVSVGSAIVIIILVIYITVTRRGMVSAQVALQPE
jgi:uncharacterized membrane-anchored protein